MRTMSDSYRHFQTYNSHRTMTVIFDNLFNESDVTNLQDDYLHQTEIESLTDEEFCYFLGHGSLDTAAEVY